MTTTDSRRRAKSNGVAGNVITIPVVGEKKTRANPGVTLKVSKLMKHVMKHGTYTITFEL